MQFNPVDKTISLIADIDFILFGDSATLNSEYSIEDRTRNINIAYDEAIAELYKADPNYKWDDTTNTDFPIATGEITSGDDHYVMLDSAQVIHRVRMKDSGGTLNTLEPVLRSELTDSELKAVGSPTKYFKIGGAVFIVPIPNYSVSDGLEIEFQRAGNHFVVGDTSKSAGFASQFHQFLSVSASLRYSIANGMDKKTAQLRAEKTAIAEAMREHYERRSPDERPRLSLAKKSANKYGL